MQTKKSLSFRGFEAKKPLDVAVSDSVSAVENQKKVNNRVPNAIKQEKSIEQDSAITITRYTQHKPKTTAVLTKPLLASRGTRVSLYRVCSAVNGCATLILLFGLKKSGVLEAK